MALVITMLLLYSDEGWLDVFSSYTT